MSLGTRIGIYRYLSAHTKSVWLLFCNGVGYKTVQPFFPLSSLIQGVMSRAAIKTGVYCLASELF